MNLLTCIRTRKMNQIVGLQSTTVSTIHTIFFLLIIICTVCLCHSSNKHIERFSHPDIQFYKPMLFDVPNFNFLIGARDHVLQLSLDNFERNDKRIYNIPFVEEKRRKCTIKGMKDEQCHNFIVTLLPIPSTNYREKQVLVCGTNAYSPECEVRPLTSMDTVTSRSESINSYSPFWNTTSLITSTGELFYGGPLDFRGIDSSIIRQKINLPQTVRSVKDKRIVRSAQHDSKWINSDANFVHSFEYDQHVYFLFRETAVEYLNCGKRVYSRISRVCKNDPGMRENWTSFLKTRINCSIPGLFPFYFDEIQSVDIVETSGSPTLYAIFNTPENSIHGSAVCAFNMDSILDAFQGPFKYQKTSNYIWESVETNKDVFECHANSNNTKTYEDLRLNTLYQLMDNVVQAVNGRPFTISKDKHFKFIAVDLIKTKLYDSVEVIFVATTNGILLKYVQWPSLSEACLVDEYQLIDPKKEQILSMKYLKDTQSLYIGTTNEVIRVSAHRCHIHHTEEKCVASGDPYCGWSKAKLKCIIAPGNNYKSDNWIQKDVFKCAQSHWSKWFTCKQHDKSSDESCQCRKKSCSDSINCVNGFEIEVTNCTQHGGWSEWSEWSSCNPSCGYGEKYRTRTCSNPPPYHNGNYCVGSHKEVKPCDNLPYCKWGPWTEWSNCSQFCSNGFKNRTRKCFDNFGNSVKGKYCQGSQMETTICNDCHSDWTNWYMTEINGNEVVEQRNKIAGQDDLNEKRELRVVPLKYCDTCDGYLYKFREKQYLLKECDCSEELVWSDWSEWSPCNNQTQNRTRQCLMTQEYCKGHHIEIQYCDNLLMSGSFYVPREKLQYTAHDNSTIIICIILTATFSILLTGVVCVVWTRQQNPKHDLSLMNPTLSEPNTYEEPEKYRVTTPLNGHTTLTRTSTLKRDFKNTSFRAKMDDSNY